MTGRHHTALSSDLPGSWVSQAACGGQTHLEPVFFPGPGDSVEVAKRICRVCPVRTECLEFAITTHQGHGIWGGLTERERCRIVRQHRRAA